MSIQQIKMMTFDVVGTLIDFEQGIIDFFSTLDHAYSREEILAAFGKAEGEQQLATPEMPFTQMLEPVYNRITCELNLPENQGVSFRASIPNWPAFPDSVEALKRLKKRCRLIALTNADNWALEHMVKTLENPFDDSVTCEDVGVNKPDPQVFAYCRGRQSIHGIALTETMHVAQSQYHDIEVSMKLGYLTSWIERRRDQDGFGATPAPKTVTKPDFHFSTLKELAGFIDQKLT